MSRLCEQPAAGSSDPGVHSPLGRGPKSVQAALSRPATHTQGWPRLLMRQCLCLMAEFRDSRQD